MKQSFFLISFLLLSLASFGQEISFTKTRLLIDGKECLKINSKDPNNVSILDMDDNEIVFLKYIHDSKYGSLYTKIVFLDQKLTFTSMSYIFTIKQLITKLVTDKTLKDCKLDPEKVEKFVLKYDEDVERPRQ